MDKKQQFLMEVQMGLIIDAVRSKENTETAIFSSLGRLEDAVDACNKIPENKTANQAACEFMEFITRGCNNDYQPSS